MRVGRNEEMWRNANDSLEGVKNTPGKVFGKVIKRY